MSAVDFIGLTIWGVLIIAVGTICGTLLHDWFDL